MIKVFLLCLFTLIHLTLEAGTLSHDLYNYLTEKGEWEAGKRLSEHLQPFVETKGDLQNALLKFQYLIQEGLQEEELLPLLPMKTGAGSLLGSEKRAHLTPLSRQFVHDVLEISTLFEYRELLARYERASNFERDLALVQFSKLPFRSSLADLKVDMGIEFTGRFPIAYEAQYKRAEATQRLDWVRTLSDLSPDEKMVILEKLAKELQIELGGGKIKKIHSPLEHGDGIAPYFELRDRKNRIWKIEWDGFQHQYSGNSKSDFHSLRGGVVELSTPKFRPTPEEIDMIFKLFKKQGITPDSLMGGGHLNIDLAPFMGRPEKILRLLELFHSYQDVMSVLFQHPVRQISAEPIRLTKQNFVDLRRSIKNETNFKKELYHKKYFGARKGRKTQYTQLNLTHYFQDIIPTEFIGEDFDTNHPMKKWRQNFLVDKEVRKMEFRLFDAPLTQKDAILQINFLHAMIQKALGEEEIHFSSHNLSYEEATLHPSRAQALLKELLEEINLSEALSDYELRLNMKLVELDDFLKTPYYLPLEKRFVNFPIEKNWQIKKTTSCLSSFELFLSL